MYAGIQAPGFSTVVPAAQYGNPLQITRQQVGGPIRSVTISNSSNATTAVVFPAANAVGQQPLYGVPPGATQTLPLATFDSISVAFVTQSGQAANGAIFVHADSQALSASGFQAATQTPVWIWDSTQWDGGASWSS